MCGIAGIVKFDRSEIDTNLLTNLSNSLRDRGSDDYGFLGWNNYSPLKVSRNSEVLQNSYVGFVHRRLSILDLSEAGWQPMRTADGRYAITFNGEIYNYLELQAELKALGYIFHSHSDTEVLLNAYAEWGTQVLNRLVGMFAFAILDTQTRSIFLARDFFGIKPLYYTLDKNSFAFASEIKALLQLPNVSHQANPQRLYDYLRYGLTDYCADTLFASIHQLPAAHYLELSLDSPTETKPIRYWQIDLNQRQEISYSQAVEQLRELFLDNVRLHLRSDVPVGAALSGGIDSSSIVMAMRHLEPNLELHSFSYTADDPKVNEEAWIDIINRSAKTVVHKVKATPQELTEDLERLIYIQDEPFGSTSIYAQHRVFRLAQQSGIKVMLDGQGADEILAGYFPYLSARLASLLRQGKWCKANQLLQRVSQLPGAKEQRLIFHTFERFLPDNFKDSIKQKIGRESLPYWLNANWFDRKDVRLRLSRSIKSSDILREELQYSVENSLPSLLRYEDRNSMAHSIESRVPFLTPALVNFMFSLPEEYIINQNGTTKAIFREAMRDIVPDSILDRKDKIGFATPEQKWLTNLRPWVEEVLDSEVAKSIPVFNLDVIHQEWQDVLQGRSKFDFRIWRWVNLIKWAEKYQVEFD
jgi:asparagine synthase (glutamine-hydrolysing)